MEKFCVFCGDKPEVRTVEHVIPKWLIELTGDPKRKARFGYQLAKNTDPKPRIFSFDAFKFPSCASCNHKYSELESTTKPIIEKILAVDSLSAIDLNILLDWFDKVRIGLWLGFQYLDNNPAGINPKFYIGSRIGINDRVLVIFKVATEILGINFIGCDFPSFTYTPSCFTLRVNNVFFLNMSYNDLFSRRIGFPYPVETYEMPARQMLGAFTSGLNRVMIPLLKKRFSIQGAEIYQPMFRYRNINSNKLNKDPLAKELYNNRYVRDKSMVWEEGVGKIFIQDNRGLHEYPSYPSNNYMPEVTYGFQELNLKIALETLEWQQYIDSLTPSLKKLPAPKKKEFLKQRMIVRSLNDKLHKILLKKFKNRA